MTSMLIYNIGGSGRQYEKDCATLKRADIHYKNLGAATLGSKKQHIGVSADNADTMKALGFSKARTQWKDYKWYDPRDNAPVVPVEPVTAIAPTLPIPDSTPEKWDRAATLPEREAIIAALNSLGVKPLGIIWNKLDREFMITKDESLQAHLVNLAALLPKYRITSFHVSREDVTWVRFDLVYPE